MFGMMNPRQQLGGGMPQAPAMPQAQQMSQPQGMPQGGARGLFDLYMSQLFNQRHAPPPMQGSPMRNHGGFFGFGSPQMPAIPPRQQGQPSQAPGDIPWHIQNLA